MGGRFLLPAAHQRVADSQPAGLRHAGSEPTAAGRQAADTRRS